MCMTRGRAKRAPGARLCMDKAKMFLSEITNRGNIPVLEKLMAFAEARQRMLAENIANIDMPGYKTKQLDPAVFQAAMRRAIDERSTHPGAPLELPATDQFHEDEMGHLVVTPVTEPAQNILFHDRTNARIETLMAQVAENVMTYNLASQLLKNSFDGLKTAIRGQI